MISIPFQKNTMTTQEVADKFYELGEANQWGNIHDELYSDDAESIEPPGAASGLQTVKGKAALKQKSIDFNNSIEEVYGGYSSKPVVGGNFFSVAMGMDAKFKGMDRIQFDEICVYEVKDGKIVKEQFFY